MNISKSYFIVENKVFGGLSKLYSVTRKEGALDIVFVSNYFWLTYFETVVLVKHVFKINIDIMEFKTAALNVVFSGNTHKQHYSGKVRVSEDCSGVEVCQV